MPSYKRPGVYAEEVLNLSSAISPIGGSVAAFIGPNPRGPVVPTLVQSWSEYVSKFGGFFGATDYLPHALHQFFSNGGRVAWVTRVAGPAPTAPATLTAARILQDTTNPTLTLTAANPGTWAQQIYVEVIQGTTYVDAAGATQGRFTLNIRYGGTSDANIVERWVDLSM